MKRSIATCKRCDTQFPMVGEITGCVNCGHPELDVQPQPADWKEMAEIAADLSNEDVDAFMESLSKDNASTKKFLEDLEKEFELDQAIKELIEEEDGLFAHNLTGGETPYEKGQRLTKGKEHEPDCICDPCCEAAMAAAAQPEKREPELRGYCRTCANWRADTPQVGRCWRGTSVHSPDKFWHETCKNWRFNDLYPDKQKDIRERRRAHESILRAIERSKA